MPTLDVRSFNVERSYEALTWEAYKNKRWEEAATSSVLWLRDQPFSSRPAGVASHFAIIREDYVAAERCASFGLVANPHENLLHVTLAFIYASTGRLEKAREHLGRVGGVITKYIEIASIANHGLIEFREGHVESGRKSYSSAVEKAKECKEDAMTAGALIYWAREEVYARTPRALSAIRSAQEAIQKLDEQYGEAPYLLNQILHTHEKLSKLDVP